MHMLPPGFLFQGGRGGHRAQAVCPPLNRNVIFKNYNMVARVVAGFHQLSYFQLHCGRASGGDGLHEHNLVVLNVY